MEFDHLDIICDIETLGKGTDSQIIQIAAIACDIATGLIIDQFNEYIDITKSNVLVDGSTLSWWLVNNPNVLNEIIANGELSGKSEETVIKDFVYWIKVLESIYPVIKFWGNGILFDNNIIKAHCEKYGIEYPILYWNDRDIRTLLDLASKVSGVYENKIRKDAKREEDVAHDGLSDCKYELRYAHKCFELLGIAREIEK